MSTSVPDIGVSRVSLPPAPAPIVTAPARASRVGRASRITSLDGIRGWAITLVMVSHFYLFASGFAGTEQFTVNVMKSGWIGVNLFFVLSGFLITGILLDSKEKPRYFRNFYARRTLRIFPLHYGVLFVLIVVAPLLYPPFRHELGNIVANQRWLWFYGVNFEVTRTNSWESVAGPMVSLGIFWSLAVEEHFYLVWPTVVKFLSVKRLVWACIGIIVTAFCLRLWIMHKHGYNAVGAHILTYCRMDDLAMGALVAIAQRTIGLARLKKWAIVGVIIGAATVAKLLMSQGELPQSGARACVLTYNIYSVMFASLIVLVLELDRSPAVGWLFKNRFIVAMGTYSYGLYVLHAPFGQIFFDWHAPLGMSEFVWLFVRGLIWGTTAFAAAYLSWHFMEKRFLALKRYFE